MTSAPSVALRIGAAIAGYFAASAAAAITYTLLVMISVQIVGVEQPSELTFAENVRMVVGFTILVGAFVVTCALLPAISAVLLLGATGLRDPLSHMAAGIVVAACAILIARNVPFMERLDIDWAIALCGVVGGFAYWLVVRLITRNTGAQAGGGMR